MAELESDNGARIVSREQVHDLKNRLTVIKGMAQLLGRQVQRADWERDRIIQRVEGLQIEIGKLEEMIEDLRQSAPEQSSPQRACAGRVSHRPPDGETGSTV